MATKQTSLGTRLRLILMLTACGALFIYASLTLMIGLNEVDRLTRQHLALLTDVTSRNLEVPLVFNDVPALEEVLRGLSSDASILEARVTDSEGRPLARYRRPAEDIPPTPAWLPDDRNRMESRQSIRLRESLLGTLEIVASRDHFWTTALRSGSLWLLATLLALTVALLAARRLQRAISDPIEQLAEAARIIAEEKRFDLRVEGAGTDEIGRLVESFNAMLKEIEQRDSALLRHRDELEDLVPARTAELAWARDAAEEASRVKSRFLANMSHEIRTPLTGVLIMARLLTAANLPPDAAPLAGKIQRAAQTLLDLLNGVLDYSRAEIGQLQVISTPFQLREIVEDVASVLEGNAAAKGLQFHIAVAPELPAGYLGDPHRLKQVLFNLLGNAVKFTENGGVELQVTPVPLADSPTFAVRFEVRDTGPGIPEENQSTIFQAFRQEGDPTKRLQGSGLGLAISNEIVGLMGGKLRCTSTLGAGSRFWFDLPLEPVSAQAGDDPVPRRTFRGHLLLVEDDPTNREATRVLLELMGCRVTTAAEGQEAVRLLRTVRDFDLVLMDCRMPVLDGYSATRVIREMERENGLTPTAIIALTANDEQDETLRCREAGMNGVLGKPFAEEDLQELLASWLGSGDSPADTTPA